MINDSNQETIFAIIDLLDEQVKKHDEFIFQQNMPMYVKKKDNKIVLAPAESGTDIAWAIIGSDSPLLKINKKIKNRLDKFTSAVRAAGEQGGYQRDRQKRVDDCFDELKLELQSVGISVRPIGEALLFNDHKSVYAEINNILHSDPPPHPLLRSACLSLRAALAANKENKLVKFKNFMSIGIHAVSLFYRIGTRKKSDFDKKMSKIILSKLQELYEKTGNTAPASNFFGDISFFLNSLAEYTNVRSNNNNISGTEYSILTSENFISSMSKLLDKNDLDKYLAHQEKKTINNTLFVPPLNNNISITTKKI